MFNIFTEFVYFWEYVIYDEDDYIGDEDRYNEEDDDRGSGRVITPDDIGGEESYEYSKCEFKVKFHI